MTEDQKSALNEQDRTVKELTAAGYTLKHASGMAVRWYPTPAQQRMANARASKKSEKKT